MRSEIARKNEVIGEAMHFDLIPFSCFLREKNKETKVTGPKIKS
jgi:hypothetical protein